MKEFKNKVAVITGAANGIGKAFSEEAAKRGMKLALIDIDEERLPAIKAACEELGAPKVITIKTDTSEYEQVRQSIARVMQDYGQIDVMYSNAGIATAGWVDKLPPQDWAWAMNVNCLGMAYYVHEVLPILAAQGTPAHFLFTASIAGLINGLRFNSSYLTSKHAAVGLAECVQDYVVAEKLDIGVSVFCPEYIHTDIHNSERHRSEKYTVPDDPFYTSDNYLDYRAGFAKNITEKGMNPAFVGPRLFRAIEENQMYIVPHMHTHEQIIRRHRAIEADLAKDEALNDEFAPLQAY